jgi:hypothetical protein
MVRTQVQLTDEQLAALRRISAETGRSIADLVREGVKLYLEAQRRPSRDELVQRALSIVGKYSSGLRDVAQKHDHYLAEDFYK